MFDPRSPLVCLIHIERCGGTSLAQVLRQNFPFFMGVTPFMWPHEPGNVLTAMELRWLLRLFPFVDAFGGHCTRTYVGYEGVTSRPIQYVTFLRDPVARYLSHYNHQVHAMSQPWTMDRFLADERFSNFMTVRLAGRADLAEAKRRLRDDFAFAGIVEHFDESLVLMKEALNRPELDLSYERLNTATNNAYRRESEEGLRQAILAQNELDLELYNYAKERFLEMRRQAGGALDEGVERLRAGTPRPPSLPARTASTAWKWLGHKPVEAMLRRAYHPKAPLDSFERVRYRVKARLKRR